MGRFRGTGASSWTCWLLGLVRVGQVAMSMPWLVRARVSGEGSVGCCPASVGVLGVLLDKLVWQVGKWMMWYLNKWGRHHFHYVPLYGTIRF